MVFKPVAPGQKSPEHREIPLKSVNINQIPLGHYNMVNEVVVLFDGSPFLYIHGANSFYERTLRSHIEGTLLNCRTHKYIGIIDGVGNFRKQVATAKEYKGNRADAKKSIYDTFPYIDDVRKTLMEDYNFVVVNGIEADDAVGILAQRLNKYPYIYPMIPDESKMNDNHKGRQYTKKKFECTSYTCVIASIDKDLLQLYCYHYDIKKHTLVLSTPSNSFITLSSKRNKIVGTGYKFLYAQTLTGDTVDNIPGLHKCGPVKAMKILDGYETEDECKRAVIKAFYNTEYNLIRKAIDKRVKEARKRGIRKKIGMPAMEDIRAEAYRKYVENRNLVYILRRQRNLEELPINTYSSALFEPVNSF